MIEWIVTSSALILLVTFLRVVIKDRVSPRLRYALWALVLLRLLIPGTLWESRTSVMTPVAAQEAYRVVESIPRDIRLQADGSAVVYTSRAGSEIRTTIPAEVVESDGPAFVDVKYGTETSVADKMQQINIRKAVLGGWLLGSAAAGVFLLAVNLKFNRNLQKKRRTLGQYRGRSVFIVEGLPTPCLFGLLRPAIYLTPDVAADDAAKAHVLAHEYAHFRQGDHIWASLRGVCLALHWYNPLVWLAAYLSRRDCELSCDEGAVRLLGEERRADYGRTLVGLVARRTTPKDLACCATTMTGGRSALKERIALLVKRPRTTAWMACIVAAACVVFAVCTFTGAAAEKEDVPEPDKPAPSASQPEQPQQPQQPEEAEKKPPVSFRREDIEEQTARILTDWLLSREEKVEDHRINSLTLREWQLAPDGGIQVVFEAELMVLVPQRDSSYWWAGNTVAAEDMEDAFYRDYDGWLVFWREGYVVLDAGTGEWSIPDIGTGGYTLDDLNQRLGIDTSAGNYMRFRALPEDLPTELMDLSRPAEEQGEWLLLAQAPASDIALYRRAWNDQRVYLRVTNQSFQVFDRDLSEIELLPALDTVEGDADITVRVLYRRYEGTYFNGASYEPGIVAEPVFYSWNAAEKYWTEWYFSTRPVQLTEDLPAIADLPGIFGIYDFDAPMWWIGGLHEEDVALYWAQYEDQMYLRYGNHIQRIEDKMECEWLPELYFEDLDGDGDRELLIHYHTGHGTGVHTDTIAVHEWDGESWHGTQHTPDSDIEWFNNDLDRIFEFYEDGTAFIQYGGSSILLDLSDLWESGYWGDTAPSICKLNQYWTNYTYKDGQITLTIAGEILSTGSPYLPGYAFDYVRPIPYTQYEDGGRLGYWSDVVLRSDYAVEPELPALTDVWRAVLRERLAECDRNYPNAYAVYDVNGDGEEELIVRWMPANAISSAWGTSVYNADGAERFHGHGELTFYSNGAISEPWSHNQGPASAIWPYDLYQYNQGYTRVGSARARSDQAPHFEDVAYADLDGDGMVFYIGEDAYYENNPVDNDVYTAWLGQYLAGAQVLPVQYVSLTEGNISLN